MKILLKEHSSHDKDDNFSQLSREDPAIVMRLRNDPADSGSRLYRENRYNTCPHGAYQMTGHDYHTFTIERDTTWQIEIPVMVHKRLVHGAMEDLRRTATYAKATGDGV